MPIHKSDESRACSAEEELVCHGLQPPLPLQHLSPPATPNPATATEVTPAELQASLKK